jgi:hypothetical protein
MVLLRDHLDALNLGQHSVDIAGESGFRDVERRYCRVHTSVRSKPPHSAAF